MSYQGDSLGKPYSSADVQSVYSTAPADWATLCLCLSVRLSLYIYIYARTHTKNHKFSRLLAHIIIIQKYYERKNAIVRRKILW